MLITLLSLCLSAELTPHEVQHAEIDTLTISQLESEDSRLDDKPSFAGWATMLGIGLPIAVGSTWLTYLAIDSTSRASGWGLVLYGVLDFFAVCLNVVGYGLTIAGTAMLPITSWRRGKYEARQQQVRARLADFESGRLQPPFEPDLDGARWELKVTKLKERRPSLGLPLGLMGGGLGAGAFGVMQLTNRAGWGGDETFGLGLGIGFICAAIALEGLGTFFLIDRLRERQEIDRELAALYAEEPGSMLPPPAPPPPPASKLPDAPVFFSYSWAL